jgi:hypothetical protein
VSRSDIFVTRDFSSEDVNTDFYRDIEKADDRMLNMESKWEEGAENKETEKEKGTCMRNDTI